MLIAKFLTKLNRDDRLGAFANILPRLKHGVMISALPTVDRPAEQAGLAGLRGRRRFVCCGIGRIDLLEIRAGGGEFNGGWYRRGLRGLREGEAPTEPRLGRSLALPRVGGEFRQHEIPVSRPAEIAHPL